MPPCFSIAWTASLMLPIREMISLAPAVLSSWPEEEASSSPPQPPDLEVAVDRVGLLAARFFSILSLWSRTVEFITQVCSTT